MSATRDKTQNFKFVYSNLYQIYRKSQNEASAEPAQAAPVASQGLVSGKVLKAENLHANAAAVSINEFRPADLLAKRMMVIPKPEILRQPQHETLDSLKGSLRDLNDLHSRLKVMLKELEDLVKE